MDMERFGQLAQMMVRLAATGAVGGKISHLAGMGSLTAYFTGWGSIDITFNESGDCEADVFAGLGSENKHPFRDAFEAIEWIEACHAAEVLS